MVGKYIIILLMLALCLSNAKAMADAIGLPVQSVIQSSEHTEDTIISNMPLPEEVGAPELSELLVNFVQSYKDGDLQKFLNLFTKDAVLGESLGHKEIRRDYDELFKFSDKRALHVEDMRWRYNDGVVSGHSNFSVLVWRHQADPPAEQSGKINMEVVKKNDQLVIRKLTYSLKD